MKARYCPCLAVKPDDAAVRSLVEGVASADVEPLLHPASTNSVVAITSEPTVFIVFIAGLLRSNG